MAYRALYRKYRPRNFDEVVGQEPIIQTLKNAIDQNKITHAYLFCGPRGTGKTSVAKIFSMAINCTGEKKPCMHCESCRSFLEGDSPDVIEIDAASNNGVDEVRELIDKVKYAPQIGKYKVYIIDEVHMMSVSAFNALLKTIEEPPKHVIFILATTDPHKVIPTILSRCQRYDFSSVSIEAMIQRLNEVMSEEGIQQEAGVVERIATLSDGGMRDALSILDQCVAYAGNSIKLADIDTIYSSLDSRDLCNYIQIILDGDIDKLLKFLQNMKEKGIDVKRTTQDLIVLIKNILFYSYTKDEKNIRFMDKNKIDAIINTTGEQKLIQFSEKLIETNDKMKSSSDTQTYFELVSLKLIEENQSVSRETKEMRTKEVETVSRETVEEEKEQQIVVIEEKIENEPMLFDDTIIIEEEPERVISEAIVVGNPTEMVEQTNQIEDLKDDSLLRLLIGANKEYKKEVMDQYDNIMKYTNDLQWGKQSNVLRNVEIVAAGSNYVIVKADNRIHAELIEDRKKDVSFQSFIKELFGDYKHIFALSEKEAEELIEDFVKKRKENNLPNALILDDLTIDDKFMEQDETTKRGTELFGDGFKIMEG